MKIFKEKKEISFGRFALACVVCATVGYVWGLLNPLP